MFYRVNPLLSAVTAPPIAEARAWVQGREFPADKPLIDLAQAVPGEPPPAALTEHLASIISRPEMARYTEIEGMPALRAALARHVSGFYGAPIAPADVCITAGCNQAFCLTMMALAGNGDEVLLPLPYYFNHQMWLDALGIRAVHLPFRPDRMGVPDPVAAAERIGPRTRAIILVTPNNPTGAIYPPETIAGFYRLARSRGIALVLDETYKDFLPTAGPPHGLFSEPGWRDTLIQLYSFSKVFSLTGYRVGSLIAAPELIVEVAKAMDCVAICAPRFAQEAALHGLEHLEGWRQENRRRIVDRAVALRAAFDGRRTGYELVSVGAYFAYVRHPFHGEPARAVAQRLAEEENVLCLPGSMFGLDQEEFLRIAFANVQASVMPEVANRLARSARMATGGR